MSSLPLVSIIIPTYNRSSILGSAIESALNQTYANKQIIVVDDGSTDDTAVLLQSYPQVNYILQPHAGQAQARNTGLNHANGFYIASLDSDDVWNPDFLDRCVAVLEEQQLDFVFANWLQQLGNGQWRDCFTDYFFLQPYIQQNPNKQWIALDNNDLRNLYTRYCPSPSSSAVIRRSSIVSGWNRQIKVGDDWCLFLDLILAKECKAAFTNNILWRKQMNGSNIYDGRDRMEVIEFLFVKDTAIFINRYAASLTITELEIFKKRYLENLVKLAAHRMLHDFKVLEGSGMLKSALADDALFTLKKIADVIASKVTIQLKKLSGKSLQNTVNTGTDNRAA